MGRGFPMPVMRPAPAASLVTYDATGGGWPATTNVSSFTYSHTATAGAFVLIDVVTDRGAAVNSLTYGGTSVTLIGTQPWNAYSANSLLSRYGIANVSGGTATIAGTLSTGALWGACGSVSYKNVKSIAFSRGLVSGSGTPSQSVIINPGQMAVGSIVTTASPGTYGGGTTRYSTTGGDLSLAMIDSSASTTFTDTASGTWGSLATILANAATTKTITYDASGGSGYTSSTSTTSSISGSWSHTAASGSSVFVIVSIAANAASGSVTRSATYNGTTMQSLGAQNFNNGSFGWVEIFWLQGAGTGSSATVSISISNPSSYTYNAVAANSISFFNVQGVGSSITNFGLSTSLSSGSITQLTGIVLQAFAAGNGVGYITQSSYSQNSLASFVTSSGGTGLALNIGNATGSFMATSSFTETISSSSTWGSIAVALGG
jgi:hypothetical protein